MSKLKTIYHDDVHKIDALIGALLESDGNGPGQLVWHLVRDQFDRIRRGDRFYFENAKGYVKVFCFWFNIFLFIRLFNDEQIKRIKEIKFSHIIKMVSGINEGLVPTDAFLLPAGKKWLKYVEHICQFVFFVILDKLNNLSANCRKWLQGLVKSYQCKNYGLGGSALTCFTLESPKSRNSLESCTPGNTFDYFVGSELSLTLAFIFLVLFIASIILLLKILVYLKNRKSEVIRVKASKLRRMTISDNVTLAQEWADHNEPYRSVEVILSSKNKSIKMRLESGERVLRSIYLKDVTGKVWIQCNHNKAQDHILIRVPKEYDLVLKFDTYYEREKSVQPSAK